MQYKSNKGFNGMGQLGILLLFIGVGLIIASIVQYIIAMAIVPPNTSLTNLEAAMKIAMSEPKNINAIRILQALFTCFLFFIPAAFYSWVCNGKNYFWLGFNKHINLFQIMTGFLIIFTANLLAGPLQEFSEIIVAHFPSLDSIAKNMENAYNEQVLIISHLNGIPDLFIALILMAFLPALFEEVFFRGAFQSLLIKWWKQPLLAILFTSLLFSLIHMSVYLFISRAILGFVLGMMFYKTKNIWVNIIAHFLNNAIVVASMYSMSNSKNKIDVSKLDSKVEWWAAIIAFFVLIILFVFLKRYSEKNTIKISTTEQKLTEINNAASFPFDVVSKDSLS